MCPRFVVFFLLLFVLGELDPDSWLVGVWPTPSERAANRRLRSLRAGSGDRRGGGLCVSVHRAHRASVLLHLTEESC